MRTVTLLLIAALGSGLLEPDRPSGAIRIAGRAVADDRGPFPALGASLFWAAWAFKHDRPRLEAHLELLAEHDFDYIRALGTVGRQPYWQGREIDWRWPDYDEVIAGLTDLAFDRYRLRVEWTIFADAEQMVPEAGDRVRLVERFAAMSKGREQKIMHFELANESWQNGFEGPEGLRQLQSLARLLDQRTTIPVAISATVGDCTSWQTMYGGVGIQIMTEHFTRDTGGPAGRWTPVLAPLAARECPGIPDVVSSNEPIGPRSSVESETDQYRIVAAAVVSWMAGVGLYVFHTDAGVWGREPLADIPGARDILKGLSSARQYVPSDIANWTIASSKDERPFAYDGARELVVSVRDDRFFGAAVDVWKTLTLTATRAVSFEVLDALTGNVRSAHDLAAGKKVEIPGQPFLVIRGRVASSGDRLQPELFRR